MDLEEEVIQDKLELASLHFKLKNYEKCVSLYSEIEGKLRNFSPVEIARIRKFYNLSPKPIVGLLIHPKLPTVLDCRAAAYEKLQRVELALKDAQKLRKMDPVNCKGYLRTGKLLLKADMVKEAYKCFQEGVYFVEKAKEKHELDISEKLLEQLKSQRRKLNEYLKTQKDGEIAQKKAPSRKVDDDHPISSASIKLKSFSNGLQRRLDEMVPLKRSKSVSSVYVAKKPKNDSDLVARLPREVIEFIFSFLPTRSLLNCHRVCKEWYATLTTMPSLYKNIFTLKHRVTSLEYFQGLKLLKKVSMFLYSKSVNSVKLWSTLNLINFTKIMESLVMDKTLRLKNLEIISQFLCYELLFKILDKCKWDFEALQTVENLRLGYSSSVPEIHTLFKVFPSLKSFELVIIDQKLRGNNKFLLPLDTTKTEEFISLARKKVVLEKLENLILVNHTGLTKEYQTVGSGSRTYTASPKFLDLQMPNLGKLTMVNFNFTNLEANFGRFLSVSSNLKEIYLENNEELDIKQFLSIVRLYEPKFMLEKLTLREKPRNSPYNMAELDAEGLGCISNLKLLDIYGSSLSNRGLLKLLATANKMMQLQSLNIGNSSFIHFKKDTFATGNDILQFSQILQLVHGVQTLYLNEMDLDNLSMKLLHQDLVKQFGYANCPLKKLDISFCHQIDGIGLMNLVNASYSQPGTNTSLKFDELVLDGLSLNKETLKLLQKRELVSTIKNDPMKLKWRQYGATSLVQEVQQN